MNSTVPKRKGRLIAAAVAVLVAALLAAFYFSPHWTVHRMRQAAEAGDAQALSAHVDFPALRESFKAQLHPMMARAFGSAGGPGGEANPLARLGQAMAFGLVEEMVQRFVSPQGVAVMLQAGRAELRPPATPPASPAPGPGPGASAPPEAAQDEAPRYRLEYLDGSTVQIEARDARVGDGPPARFILKRHGLVDWKLSAVELSLG